MDRQERDRNDYGSYDDYRNDSHYHSARNLTDEFERDYRNTSGSRDTDRDQRNRVRSYHEGDMGDAYERRSREGNYFSGNSDYRRNDWNQNRGFQEDRNYGRDRFSNYQDDYRSYQGMDRSDSMDLNRNLQGNMRQGYGISDYEGTSDRFNTLNSDRNRSDRGKENTYYSGSRGDHNSRFGSNIGESSTHSDRGIPNYGTSSFADDYGTGMGSSYGGRNYGGGNRGGSFGNENYGSSSGNYGGAGSMGSGSYGQRGSTDSGRSRTSHYGYRDNNELDRY